MSNPPNLTKDQINTVLGQVDEGVMTPSKMLTPFDFGHSQLMERVAEIELRASNASKEDVMFLIAIIEQMKHGLVEAGRWPE